MRALQLAKPVYLCARGSKFGRSPRSRGDRVARRLCSVTRRLCSVPPGRAQREPQGYAGLTTLQRKLTLVIVSLHMFSASVSLSCCKVHIVALIPDPRAAPSLRFSRSDQNGRRVSSVKVHTIRTRSRSHSFDSIFFSKSSTSINSKSINHC